MLPEWKYQGRFLEVSGMSVTIPIYSTSIAPAHISTSTHHVRQTAPSESTATYSSLYQ